MLKEDANNYIPKMNSWLLPRENGMLLSDHHVDVLMHNNIDYRKYQNLKELLFALNEIKDDDEELEEVILDLTEMDYYSK